MGVMSEKALPRPRQVTTASVVAGVGSVLLVLSLADTLGRLRTAESRRSIEEVLAEPPVAGTGVTVEQVLRGLQVLVYAGGVLAAVTLVLAVFVAQRHQGARIGYTVAAVLLLVTVPVAGLMPLFLLLAAGMMWSRPARDWYAGRAPSTAAERTPAPPSAPPSAPPTAHPPAPPTAPPSAPPSAPTPVAVRQSAAPPSTTAAPEPAALGHPVPGPWPAPSSGSGAHPWPGSSVRASRRPATVTVAVVLTVLGAAVTSLGALLLMVVLARDTGEFIRRYEQSEQGTTVAVTHDQLLAIAWALAAGLLLWCLVAVLLAFFALRRSQGARIGLVVSAVLAGGFSLLAIVSVVTVVPLLLSVAVVVLLFTGGANDWYARRTPPPPGAPRPPSQRQQPW